MKLIIFLAILLISALCINGDKQEADCEAELEACFARAGVVYGIRNFDGIEKHSMILQYLHKRLML